MKSITKIILLNFKRFNCLELEFNADLNILIGDNESGKSSILTALDLVLSGSKSKIETLNLEALFHTQAIDNFLTSDRRLENLPTLFVEIYLNEQNNPTLNGKNNSKHIECDGLKLECAPADEYHREIQELLSVDEPNFPFEYYTIKFTTFSGEAYTGYRKFLRHLVIDSSQINNEYATREYTKSVYNSHASVADRSKYANGYRKHKTQFKDSVLNKMNDGLTEYKFSVRTGTKSNLETDLVLSEDDIPIENKGKGRQCFIKTEFALRKNQTEQKLDTLLLEEPENHLSHSNMKKLIRRISESIEKQVFIATHSNLVCTRLGLQKAIILDSDKAIPITLKSLTPDTATFFTKASDNNFLEFVLSKKVILVEGNSEFILIDAFYTNYNQASLESDDVHVIAIGGTSFKRYLEIAKLLNIKTAVVRDNDADYETTCVNRYLDYQSPNVKVFADKNNVRSTFEICVYEDNTQLCDLLFKKDRATLSVQEYMLKNKTDAAFALLEKAATQLSTPEYINEAIAWIKE